MFADDTNLFLSNRDINELFLTVNQEHTFSNMVQCKQIVTRVKPNIAFSIHLLMQIEYLYVYQNWQLTIQLLSEKIQ